ncbi:hypothetical protein C1I97_03345 [Streptomyces sp. NTH33]|nr:hypothetical protein C1I97_03345 [Streptomyces sp. NTH33]
MRQAVNVLLDPDAAPDALPPAPEKLDTLTLQLRGHLQRLMPEVERSARKLPKNSVTRYCVLACLGEARERLRAEPSQRYGGPAGHARRLARALNALLDHHEKIGGHR